MNSDKGITQHFGTNLAELLSEKIIKSFPKFDKRSYIKAINEKVSDLSYTQRIELHAIELHNYLPKEYEESINILTSILGDENPNETGMFTEYYWVMPIGKYVETFGLKYFDYSIYAIEEITKRNTGEYAIRPYLRIYPEETIQKLKEWAKSTNFHLRRLASEGSRPKLPWSTKLETFIENPEPVFEILNILKEDEIKFVKKSVANNITDYLKVNYEKAKELLIAWSNSSNINTKWIIKYATRKISI